MIKKLSIFLAIIVGLIACQGSKPIRKTFKDSRDGQRYGYVTIEDCSWMTENMRFNIEGSKYNPNNPDTLFGRLYNGYQAKEACPQGWQLASTYAWMSLERLILPPNSDSLYKKSMFRGKNVKILKSKKYWDNPGSDSIKLNFLPAGIATSWEKEPSMLYKGAFFWTSSVGLMKGTLMEGLADYRYIHNDSLGVFYDMRHMDGVYMSCRCVRYPNKKNNKNE